MNRRIASVAAGSTAIAAALVIVLPQHAASIVRLLSVTVAVVAGGLVLASVAPIASRHPSESALDRTPVRTVAPLDPHGLRDARRDLDRPAAEETLPAPVRERLVVAVGLRAQQLGIAIDSPVPAAGPATAATRRDPAAVARIVHRTLDDLDSLAQSTGGADGHR